MLVDLEHLKSFRSVSVRALARRETLPRRALRKFSELWACNFSAQAILKHFTLHLLRLVARRSHGAMGTLRRPAQGRVIVALRVTGGVGDCIVVARFLAHLALAAKGDYQIDIFFNAPKNVEFIFADQPRIRQVLNDALFERARRAYTLSGIVNQFLMFYVEDADWSLLVQQAPGLCAVVSTSERERAKYEKYIAHHPALDGAFSDAAARSGFKRHNFLHHVSGIPYVGDALAFDLPDVRKFGLPENAYITIHDGWDHGYRMVAQRPTKAYLPERWHAVVAAIKLALPGIKVVQLGGKNGERIANADINLRGMTSIAEACAVVRDALVHIDTESGFVHAASCFGTPCVVVFGPTNPRFFSYDGNANILPGECGNCWWSTDTWMDACPRGLAIPACQESISPERIAASVIELTTMRRERADIRTQVMEAHA